MELKTNLKHERDDYTNCNCCSWYSNQRISTGTGGFENNRMSQNHPLLTSARILKSVRETYCNSKRSNDN